MPLKYRRLNFEHHIPYRSGLPPSNHPLTSQPSFSGFQVSGGVRRSLWRLGILAERLLYEPPQNKPPWRQQIDFTSEAAFQAYTKAMASPHSFLTITNSKYDAITPFGHTHSTRTPEQWATQILGLNFVTSSAQCLRCARHLRHSAVPYQGRSRDPQIHSTPSRCKPGLLPPAARTPLRRPSHDPVGR